MVATYIKKIKCAMICVSGVYLGDKTNTFFSGFALECKSSEHLPFLHLDEMVGPMAEKTV